VTTATAGRAVDAACPLRPGHPCTLCHPEAFVGPRDCPTVALVMDDPDLRLEAARLRRRHREPAASAEQAVRALGGRHRPAPRL